MGTDKPLISILMAVYEPRMDWLKEQLDSLNAQTYPNLRLYVRDDCSPTVPFAEIQAMVEGCITKFPYTIQRNEKNLGSNLTFERLTQEAEGEYFAYCDQDDIWLPEKLSVLQNELECSGAQLVCSDVLVIGKDGEPLADSITKVRKRHVFHSGTDLASGLIYRNFVIGCTMLIRASVAREALPFLPDMVHDHYLALYCALRGEIRSLKEALVCYRVHSENQTAVLSGVKTKEDYFSARILTFSRRTAEIHQRFPALEMREAIEWAQARLAYYQKKPQAGQMLWELRKENVTTTVFELIALKMPPPIFQCAVKLVQRGVL